MSEIRPSIDAVTACPTESTLTSFHEPRVYIGALCVESCRSVRRLADSAVLQAVQHPDSQIDIACLENRRVGCNARVVESGSYGNDFGSNVPGSDELFLASPIVVETASKQYCPPELVEQAITQGINPIKPSEL